MATLAERFWAKVQRGAEGECWLWIGGRDSWGYGAINIKGKQTGAHRFAWELANGPISEGKFVLHDCPAGDNPSCVNPAHLRLGTHAENMADRQRKGRCARPAGEKNPRAKLTEDLARLIHARHASGESQGSIARSLHVSRTAVYQVLVGKRWAYLGLPKAI